MDAAVLGVVEVVQGRRRGGAVVIGPAHLVAAHVQPFHFDQVLLQAEAGHVDDDPRRGALVAHAGLILGGEDPLPGRGAVVGGVVRRRTRNAGQVPVLADAARALSEMREGWWGEIGRSSCREIVCQYRWIPVASRVIKKKNK